MRVTFGRERNRRLGEANAVHDVAADAAYADGSCRYRRRDVRSPASGVGGRRARPTEQDRRREDDRFIHQTRVKKRGDERRAALEQNVRHAPRREMAQGVGQG